MVSQHNLLLLGLGYGLVVGVLYAFETLVDQLLPTLTESQQSYVGVAALASGLPGAVFGGYIMDITQAYKEVNILLCFGTAAALAGVAALTASAVENYTTITVSSNHDARFCTHPHTHPHILNQISAAKC